MTILFFKKYKHNRERVSCLSAISTDGFIIYKLFKGTVTSENYLSFIKDNIEYFKTLSKNILFLSFRFKLLQTIIILFYENTLIIELFRVNLKFLLILNYIIIKIYIL